MTSQARLGPFVLGEVLGRGGMGTVHAAVHEPTGTLAAVKTLDPDPDAPGVRVTALHEEATLAAGLDHPSLVPVLDFGVVPEGVPGLPAGSGYLVMVRGTHTLSGLVGELAWPDLRDALEQLIEGLAHAHARGVLHCDVKPSNVLLGVRRDPREPLATPLAGLALTDFGIARRLGRGGGEGPSLGTPRYTAPEQARGGALGPWTDLFGLGALGWALATGAPPAPGEAFAPRAPMPIGLEAWLRRLLAPDPSARFQCAAAARIALPARDAPLRAPAAPSTADTSDDATQAVPQPVALASPQATTVSVDDAPLEVPEGWRPRRPTWPSPSLQGAGLGVFGMRPAPWVAREAERDTLWQALRDVSHHGGTRLVRVTGPAGVGRSRLLDWIRHRAHELAGAQVHSPQRPPWLPSPSDRLTVVTLDEPQPDVLDHVITSARRSDPSGTLVVVAMPVDESDAPEDSWQTVAVEPLHPADTEALARGALPLEPWLVLALQEHSQGRPGVLLTQLATWLTEGRLQPGPHGYRLDPAAPADDDALSGWLLQATERLAHGQLRAAALAVQRASAGVERLAAGDRRRAELLALTLRLDPSVVPPAMRAALTTALEAAADAGGWSDLKADVLARRAVTASNRGDPDTGRTLATQAIHLADDSGSPRLQVATRLYLGHMSLLVGDTGTARRTFDELLVLAADHPEPALAEASGHVGLSMLHRRAASWSQAVHHAQHAARIAVAAGLHLERARAMRALGAAQTGSGHHASAAETWRAYIDLARDLGLTADLPNAWSDLGESLRHQGHPIEAERAYQHAVSLLRGAEQSDVIPRMNLARLYVDTDRFDEAWALVGPDAVDIPSIGWTTLHPQLWALRACAACGVGLGAAARRALAMVVEDPADPGLGELLALARRLCAEVSRRGRR